MALTDAAIKKAKATDKLQKLSDGAGLQLHIAATGSKLWRLAYRFEGKQKTMALGAYPAVSLSDARVSAGEARKLLSKGVDPMAQKASDKQATGVANQNSFEAVARQWLAVWGPAKSPRHAEYVMRRLEADIFPVIGKRPITSIEAPELVRMAELIEKRGALDIAKRSLQTTSPIFG